MVENNFLLFLKNSIYELFSDIIFFPKWLFFEGTKRTIRNARRWIEWYSQKYAIAILVKNIGQPMYGQDDWQGRIISFFVRFFHLLAVVIGYIVWSLGVIALMALWFAWPILLLWEIGYQFHIFPRIFF